MPIPTESPILVAPTPTPFAADDSVDYGALTRNINRWLETPLSGFVLTTANGEEHSLSEEERVEIVGVVSRAHAGKRFTIAGIDNPSERETNRLAYRYADAGADLIRVRIPSGLTPDAVCQYFRSVTENSPVPVIVIHQTFSAGPASTPDAIGEVCSLPNVFGYITDHDLRFEGYVRPLVADDRRFWICNGGLLSHGALLGADGACMWLGNIAPDLCRELMSLGIEDRFSQARPLQESATRLDQTIIQYGVAGVKAALDIMGFEGMRPRAPLPGVPEQGRQEIATALGKAGLT